MTTVEARRDATVSGFLLRWSTLTLLGWTTGGFILFLSVWPLFEVTAAILGIEEAAFEAQVIGGRAIVAAALAFGLAALAGGAVAGSVQALALRDRLDQPARWAAATSLGLGFGLLVGITVALAVGRALGWAMDDQIFLGAVIIASTTVALVQWQVLRRRYPGSALWIAAGMIGMLALFGAAVVVGGEGREWLAIIVGALLMTLITGPAMARIVEDPGAVRGGA